ncbi:MAG: hypothetical protein ACM3O9_06270 [Methylocystaceae bacterium]
MNQVPTSILFVCTGNTCRSPMAAAICTDLIAKNYPQYKDVIEISSAGCRTIVGIPATKEAIKVMAAKAISITDHRSRPVETYMLEQADLIVVMGEGHRYYLHQGSRPEVREKIFSLREIALEMGDIVDPIGQGEETYRQTAEELERLIVLMLQRLLK